MAADSQDRHRPGVFKQPNKSHKTGRHRSKGKVEKEFKGTLTSVKVLNQKQKLQAGKQARRNQVTQIRKTKREQVLAKKRSHGGPDSAPMLVAIIPLSEGLDPESALKLFKTCDESSVVKTSDLDATYISVPRFKQRFGFLVPPYGDLYAMLDAAKVADSILFLLSPSDAIDKYGEHCLSCLYAQGLPSSIVALQGLKKFPAKKQGEMKKNVQKAVQHRFSQEKFMLLDTAQEAMLLMRNLGTQRINTLGFREKRPHLMADSVSFELNDDENSTTGTLKLSGYLRSQALSVNGLVHLPGWGDFQMAQIDAPDDPYPLSSEKQRKAAVGRRSFDGGITNGVLQDIDMKASGVRVLEKADPSLQASLQSENIPDEMDAEQTWPTEEELQEAEGSENKRKKSVKKVPKGTSTYQAAWIVDSAGEEEEDDDEEEEDEDMADDEDSESEEEEEEEEEEEDGGVSDPVKDETYDAEYDAEEDEALLAKYKAARMDEQFPDEIDTPQDIAARDRFQRYRGLKSFRTSTWDPKENLPLDYSRIFQFSDFRRTKKRVLTSEADGGALPGWYVTIHIINVPKELMEKYNPGTPIVAFGLLSHEQKMSVLNMVVKRHRGNDQPIKSKERIVFHVGYRRFSACPIYSEHTNCDKHKFSRYLTTDGPAVATVYAPIVFPPSSVLMFKETQPGCHELIATGSILSISPDRLVVKRVVLSGHPFKINRRHAVVRYMFFNREDILWFKPVELRTKWGRRGHVKEALGTHGHMKCVFDGQLKSQDTVMMNLYKRMFPKWTYDARVESPGTSSGGITQFADVNMDEFFD
ncbi:hypothetical protein CAPTEDRAFT_173748 [Capitella teleta]|uniref:Pre-rRNA-processing protein TSR1 homolog n=1 Tax=Capitella teleta TaxID=283909 RepID=R7UAG6_CAPTE|nr:hypothetical protein CAPTEDRAFT_173748 [Capitella teleta]|eukprot:ELU03121.1 hypothetical protein CAPTEDRAFT_173748 [Capitella teleta]